MTTTRPKQTAGNNADLARVKKLFNKLVYKATLDEYNFAGREAARTYVGKFFNDEWRERRLAELFPAEG